MSYTQVNTQSTSTQQPQINTLDEDISTTIKRDLSQILQKVKAILFLQQTRDWDWWGPLLFCLLLSVRLSIKVDQGPAVFSATFFIIWFGSAVVTLNATLLGVKISFFQSVCVLGYCIFPLVVASFVTWVLPFFIKFIVVLVAFLWSTFGIDH